MHDDGSKLCNIAVLADAAQRVELLVPVEKLDRIASRLSCRSGVVIGSVAFTREQGRIIAEVALTVTLEVRCERCLELMQLPVASQSRVALISSEAEVDAVPPELETALAPEGKMRLADLVEEELLLALPAAPRHEPGCGPAAQREKAESTQESPAVPTQHPFAGLGRLMRSDRSK
jgi:uncharacterized protein